MTHRRLMCAALFLGAAVWASATTVNSANGDATATFTFGAGFVTIQITDLVVDPNSVSQNVSALSFVLSSGTTATEGTQSGTLRTITGTGAGNYSDTGTTALGWVLAGSGGSYSIDVLSGGGAGPAHTLIGKPNASNAYASAGGSITGSPHNPFLANTMTITLNITGVTAATTLVSSIFQFGTTDGTGTSPGVPPSEVPEPVSFLLGGTGLAGLALLGWRRKSAQSRNR